MSNKFTEIYRTLLQAQKPKEDGSKHLRNLGRLISNVFDEAKNGKITKNFYEDSKKLVLQQLYSKCEALHTSMNYTLISSVNPKTYLVNETEFLKLSNYYRSAYYSFFYLGRAIILECDDKDCSEHAALWDLIIERGDDLEKQRDKLNEIIQTNKAKGHPTKPIEDKVKEIDDEIVMIDLVRNAYEDLKKYREIGDYSILDSARDTLADSSTILDVENRVSKAIKNWLRLK